MDLDDELDAVQYMCTSVCVELYLELRRTFGSALNISDLLL